MRLKKVMPVFIAVAIILIGAVLAFAVYFVNRQSICYEKISNQSVNVSKEEAKNSSPIIINNILLGARYKNKFVSADKFFDNSPKNTVKISTFIEGGKTGAYDVNGYKKNPDGHGEIFVETTYKNFKSEFIAVTGEAEEIMQRKIDEEEVTKEAEEIVKKNLNKLLVPNKTVNVRKVYECELTEGVKGNIIVATSKKDREKGVYSTVIYVENGKSSIVKLNYIKDVNKSATWPIYNVKFVCDLNSDDKYEIVLEEVTEFDVKYSVMEKRGNKFTEVLSTKSEVKTNKESVKK